VTAGKIRRVTALNPELAGDERIDPTPAFLRVFRRVSGPETTGAEAAVLLAGAVTFSLAAVALGLARAPGWSALQWVLAAGLAFDFGGGVVTNAMVAAKRWFHRAGRVRARAAFYVLHVQPLVLALFFSTPWAQAAALYAGMLAAAALVELAPRRIAQPVAFGLVALGLVASGVVSWPPGLEWFAPVYLLKLVGAHAVPPPA
jgi:hypothetical protein